MTTKQYLFQIHDMEVKIRLKRSEIEHMRSVVAALSGAPDGDRVQKTGSYDPMADRVATLVDEESRLTEMIDAYAKIRSEIIAQIEEIENPRYYSVLYGKYVVGMSLYDICDYLGVTSKRHIIRLHGQALAEFQRKFGEKYASA